LFYSPFLDAEKSGKRKEIPADGNEVGMAHNTFDDFDGVHNDELFSLVKPYVKGKN
jgi:hypothetical protein